MQAPVLWERVARRVWGSGLGKNGMLNIVSAASRGRTTVGSSVMMSGKAEVHDG